MATLYFYKANDASADWCTLSNWWQDTACTQQATQLPTASDDIVVYSIIAQSSCGTPTVKTALIDGTKINLHPIGGFGEVWLSIELNVTELATFRGELAYLYSDDAELSPVAKVNGDCVFQQGAAPWCSQGLPPETFDAIVNGDAYFYNDSYNHGALITGNAYVYEPAENPLGGVVNGTITYIPLPTTRVFRSMHFPHRRREVVSAEDPTPVNVQPGELLYDEETNKLYAGLEDTSTVEIVGGTGGGGSGDYLPLSGGTMTGAIVFDGASGQYINKGNFDTSRGGSYGISMVCAVGYEFNWQAGWLITTGQSNTTPRPLYLDSVAGTTLRVWDAAEAEGIEISHTGITFADSTTQDSAGVTSKVTGITGAAAITNIVSITQAAYDALATKNATTLYIING
jgi:hypothetical protein